MAKVGDIVRFLNSVGGGRIVRIDGNIAHVEDEDGFEVPALLKECVVVIDSNKTVDLPEEPTPAAKPQEDKWWEKVNPKTKPSAKTSKKDDGEIDEKAVGIIDFGQSATEIVPRQQQAQAVKEEVIEVTETPDGDDLNVVLAFEAVDLKKLSTTSFEAELVNDSNYYLSFTLSSKAETDKQWTLIKAATVEPNIVLTLGGFDASALQHMDRILFQYVAYKQNRSFAAKSPASVEHKVDTTKFFKLHCFKENPYFDQPVIAFDIVSNDHPYAPFVIDEKQLRQAIREKRAADRPKSRPVVKKHVAKSDGIIEVDLHINQLIDSTRGLSNADMLNLQIDEFRRVMDENIKNKGQKIVFIHGKGEGVLRQAIMKELNHRYKGHDVQDASFREYGFGATQVTI